MAARHATSPTATEYHEPPLWMDLLDIAVFAISGTSLFLAVAAVSFFVNN